VIDHEVMKPKEAAVRPFCATTIGSSMSLQRILFATRRIREEFKARRLPTAAGFKAGADPIHSRATQGGPSDRPQCPLPSRRIPSRESCQRTAS
jgi:hypothetical protein